MMPKDLRRINLFVVTSITYFLGMLTFLKKYRESIG